MRQLFYQTIYGIEIDSDQIIEEFLSENMKLIVEKLQLYGQLPFYSVRIPREGCTHCGTERDDAVPIKDIEQLRQWKILTVTDNVRTFNKITELGSRYIMIGLPEKRLFDMLPVRIDGIPLETNEKTVAIGLLKKINAIKIVDGIVRVDNLDAYLDHERRLMTDLVHNNMNRDLINRGLQILYDENERFVELTEIGKNLMGN